MIAQCASEKYDDIINLPHHVSVKHPQMPLSDRAVQFAPFAALTGYGDAVKESARVTDEQLSLDEYTKSELSRKLQLIAEQLDDEPQVSITYFQPDTKKAGGAYITTDGIVKKVDTFERTVTFTDKTTVNIESIIEINSDIFDDDSVC